MASSLQVFSQDSLLIADGDGGARKAATEDQLPSPDSSVTLLGDEFLRSPFGAAIAAQTAAQTAAMSYKDVLASFGASSDVRNFPGTFEDEPNNHHRSSLRSPAPSGGLLGTSADSAGTGGSAPGLGSSIWAMGSSGNNGSAATIRDPSNKMSPQMSWSAMDSFSGDRGASLLGPPTPAAAFWDAGPVPGVDHSGDLESDFNRSFETLALEDGPVASGLMGQGLYTPGSVSPNTAVSSTYATPHRPGRDSFSANAAAANGVPARNLLSTPPNKAFTAPYAPGQQGSADSSPAAAFGFGASPIPLAGQSAPSTPRRALQTYGADASQYQSGRANVQGLGMGAPYISTSSPYLPPQAATDMLSNWRSPLPRQLLDMSPQSQQMPFHDALSNAKVRDHDIPTRSLWIGNLDPAVDAAMLVRIFSVFGPIESLRVLHDRDCAFVNFTDITSALRARSQMEGSRIGSQVVRMGFGRIERDERIEQQPTRSVWIGNLPTGVEIEDLMATFNRFGPIESARVLTHKNCGFVNFERLDHAIEAVRTMHGRELGGNVVRLGYAKVPRDGVARPGSQESDYALVGAGSPPSNSLSWYDPATVEATPPQSHSRPILKAEAPSFEPSAAPPPPSLSQQIQMPQQLQDEYSMAIPELPEPRNARRVDQNRLREMRRRLELRQEMGGTQSAMLREVDSYFAECEDEFVELSTDYIGNVVLQKILERAGDGHRQRFLNRIAPYMAAIGVHKNGTWLVQKVIQLARTPQQMDTIVAAVKPYTVQLLLDQVGNYVVQGCLRLTDGRNQFVFDAMTLWCLELGTGRYGARAMRTCLESAATTPAQHRQVANAIVQSALHLSTNPNGVLLVTWLLETSGLSGRYRMLAPLFSPHVGQFACDKLASTIIVKLINQRSETDARDAIFDALFFADGWRERLREVLGDFAHGVALLQKILSSTYVDGEDKVRVADRIRQVLAASAGEVARNANAGYRRLLEELKMLPVGAEGRQSVATLSTVGVDAGFSPLRSLPVSDSRNTPSPYESAALLQAAGNAFRVRTGMSDFAPLEGRFGHGEPGFYNA